MNRAFISTLAAILVAMPYQVASAASAKVSGGYGCDRSSEWAVCFADQCVCGFSMSIDGEIDSSTVGKVRKLFEVRRANKRVDEGFAINSPGGDIAAAMAIGRMFREERAWLHVNGVCISACVLILAGAVDRSTNFGRVGIHRPYFLTTT